MLDPDLEEDVIKLALKKQNLDENEAVMMLLDPFKVEDLKTELLTK